MTEDLTGPAPVIQVRAKFTVTDKTETVNGYSIRMVPVTSGGPENEAFFKWTPGGELKMQTINPAAAAALIVGRDYYVDFTPAQ